MQLQYNGMEPLPKYALPHQDRILYTNKALAQFKLCEPDVRV